MRAGGGGGGGGSYIWGELMSLQATEARLIVGDQVDAKHGSVRAGGEGGGGGGGGSSCLCRPLRLG